MSRLGIIAGGGGLPARLVDACRRDARDCFVLGFEGQTDAELNPHAWSRLGAAGATLKILKDNNVDTLVLAGAMRRPSLGEIRPDWKGVKILARLGLRAMGDDALLRIISDELEKEGFTLIGAHEVEPSLLTPVGVLGKVRPKGEHEGDIAAGIKAAKALGAMDIGQAAVVQQGIVLGLEAVEGTDALIARCGKLKRKGRGGVLVKSCKPQQDRRLDLPAIGLKTVRKCFEAGIAGIALEADASLIIDREETVAAADSLGIFIMGFEA